MKYLCCLNGYLVGFTTFVNMFNVVLNELNSFLSKNSHLFIIGQTVHYRTPLESVIFQ